MSQLSVQQRKMVYAGFAVLLIIPIVLLGGPANETPGSGWWLAQKRYDYELGEASLGNVDPTSSAMNLVLLGFRGVAASMLWQQAEHHKERKNFDQLQESVDSIILLQPHFKTVWEFQAWNLAFNVSAECDAVEDRYYWVKRGAKFLQGGTERNKKIPELFFETGRFYGQKIGRADEREVFREFFVSDPDEETWKGGPDLDINPDGKDNYLVARDWYAQSNEVLEEDGVEQHKMDLALFIAYPYRSLMDYAVNLQSDGLDADLDAMSTEERINAYEEWAEGPRSTWEQAYDEWTGLYGTKEIMTAGGGLVVLEPDTEKLKDLAEAEGVTLADKQHWQRQYHKITNYPYWKQRCDIEKRVDTARAKYYIVEGRRLHRDVQDFENSKVFLEKGMGLLEGVIDLYQRPDGTNALLSDEMDLVEEAIKAVLVYQQVLEFLGEPQPEQMPLSKIWDNPDFAAIKEELYQRFQLSLGSGAG